MTSPILSVTVEHEAAVDRVRAQGELDIATTEPLWDALSRSQAASRDLVLDLSDLSFCDVPGVRLLRDAAFSAARDGLQFRVSGVHGQVARVLRVLDVSLPTA